MTYPVPTALSPGTVSQANATSNDGTTIVGFVGSQAVAWLSGVATDLPNLPGSSASTANACSANGSIIVGSCTVGGNPMPVYWSGGSVTQLEGLGGGDDSGIAYACSADGTVILGGATLELQGVFWTNGNISALESLSGSTVLPSATNGCSDNGTVFTGSDAPAVADQPPGIAAVTWASGSIAALANPSGSNLLTVQAMGISGDGSTAVGFHNYGGIDPNPAQVADVWTSAGVSSLGMIAGGGIAAAFACSSDGSVIVGEAFDGSFVAHPVVWEAGSPTVLSPLPGVGSSVGSALAISRDATIVVGYGNDALGNQTALLWGTLPTPTPPAPIMSNPVMGFAPTPTPGVPTPTPTATRIAYAGLVSTVNWTRPWTE